VYDTEDLLEFADRINPDNVLDFEQGIVPTDVMLIVRSRNMDNLRESYITTVMSRETDFVTAAGMLRFAQLINEDR